MEIGSLFIAKQIFQLSIVYGIIGSLVIAPPSVVRAQELIRELSLSKNPMEGLVREASLKLYSARIKNAQVRNLGQNCSLSH